MTKSEMDIHCSTLHAMDRPHPFRILFTSVRLAKDFSRLATVLPPSHPTTRTSIIKNADTDPGPDSYRIWSRSWSKWDILLGAGIKAAVGIAVHFFSVSVSLVLMSPFRRKQFSLNIVLLVTDASELTLKLSFVCPSFFTFLDCL